MEICDGTNEINNAAINRRLLGGENKAVETTAKPCKSSQLLKKESKGFNFSSRLMKVTEEDRMEKPKRRRNWKGRRAAERAKKLAASQQAEIDRQKLHQTVDVDAFWCLDGCIINTEESITDLLTSLNCLPDVEDYLTSMPLVNSLGELSSVQTLETQTTGKVFYHKNRDLTSFWLDILQRKIREAWQLNLEESKLLKKIDRLVEKLKKVKSKLVNGPCLKEFIETEN